MTTRLPLAGLNIVVTRPREQAALLAQGIIKLGGSCTRFPLLEVTPLTDDRALRDLISRLHEFQLAIFISPNAVRYGMEAINHSGGLPESVQVATVGQGSAKALFAYGIKKALSPQQGFDSEALLEMPELHAVRNRKIVIFRGETGRELLGDTLKSRGAIIEYAACYHRHKSPHNAAALLGARPDVLTVSSSEALSNLAEMLSATDRAQLNALPLFVSHERIAAAAHQMGWQDVITTAAGDAALLSSLVAWAESKDRKSGNTI